MTEGVQELAVTESVARHPEGEALGLGLVLLTLGLLALGGTPPPEVPGRAWEPTAQEAQLLKAHWQREMGSEEARVDGPLEGAWGKLQAGPTAERGAAFALEAQRFAGVHGERALLLAGRRLALELEGLLRTSGCQWQGAGEGRLGLLGGALLGQARTAGALPASGACGEAQLLLLRELFLRTWATLGGLDPEQALPYLEKRLLGRWLVEASETLTLEERVQRAEGLAPFDPRFSYLFTVGVLAVRDGEYQEGKRLLLASVQRREGAARSAGRLLWILSVSGLLD